MANKVQKLPGAATRYFVEEPLMMVSIGEFEQMVQHMNSMTMIGQYPEKQANTLKQQHRLYIEKARKLLDQAKAHYKIKN